MERIAVGEYMPMSLDPDGVYLLLDDSGFSIICNFMNPTQKEKEAFMPGTHIDIGIGVHSDLMYWCVKMGDNPMMDCTYSPNIEPHVPELMIPQKGQGYSLLLVLRDGDTGVILGIRLVTLPYECSIRVREIIKDVSSKKIDYNASLRSVYSHTTEELYKMADTKARI